MNNQFDLLRTRRFLPFFCTQFLGAFNDNVFKQSLIILLAFNAASMTTLAPVVLTNLCAGLFILPFFLFSATAGQLADKFDKTRIIRLVKTAEILIMILAGFGFHYQQLWMLLLALFLMGTHSSVFGPIKYAILPQSLEKDELVGGNALVETGTSLAILLGSMLGGWLISLEEGGRDIVSWTVLGIAFLGFLVSWKIPQAPAGNPDLKINWNPLSETWHNYQFVRKNRVVMLSIMGISWFWYYGATFLTQIPAYTKDVLGGNEHVVTFLLTVFSVGIAIGSLLCEKLSDKRVELGLVPFGSIGLTLFGVDLFFATNHLTPEVTTGLAEFIVNPLHYRVIFDLVGIGIFGGFYIVPLYSLVQSRSEPAHRARTIAGNNIMNALFMVCSAIIAVVVLKVLHLTISELFLLTAVFSAIVSMYIFTLVPEFLMRFLVWIFMSLFYRVDRHGLQHIPEEGPCVVVCNHVSFYDALILSTAIRRPMRFVMDHHIFKIPVVSFIFRTARAIPVAPAKEDPEMLDRAYDAIAAALAEGEIVCIFPEGRITDNGEIYPFKNGIQRIVDRTPTPVVPLALRGMWGSFSSRRGGAAFSKLPRRFRSRVEVVAGLPVLPEHVTPEFLQERVRDLRGDCQ
ncbi:MAG: MFS transporter [Fluviicoccus sp.]|uniref:MFS transporter n=1 Tax=Fluviicoccus sp. TaxID=2003552 RepID=UPI0027247812|nr:MFS transporter [Fluviicoccus sp.]MDO8329012.1 MFS transporter [Fluviicoccus sp.]